MFFHSAAMCACVCVCVGGDDNTGGFALKNVSVQQSCDSVPTPRSCLSDASQGTSDRDVQLSTLAAMSLS